MFSSKIRHLYLIAPIILGLSVVGCASKPSAQASIERSKAHFQAKNYNQSFAELQRAAGNGDPDAEYALGYHFYYGQGTTQDTEKAIYWFEQAANKGLKRAKRALSLIRTAESESAEPAETKADNKAVEKPLAPTQTTELKQVQPAPAPQKAEPKREQTAAVPRVDVPIDEQEQQLLNIPSSFYTIQLLGSRNKEKLSQFVTSHNLQQQTYLYQTMFEGKPWYSIVYGVYPSQAQAMTALKQLPEAVQQQQPWIKPFSVVQDGIRQRG